MSEQHQIIQKRMMIIAADLNYLVKIIQTYRIIEIIMNKFILG